MLCVCACVWLVGQRPWPAVYRDYESRWTAMLTGEGSLTLGVSVLTLPPPLLLLLLGFTCLQSSAATRPGARVAVCGKGSCIDVY